jgi:putative phosphoesterase
MSIKLAVVSDSHNALLDLEKLLIRLDSEGIKNLAHAGDFMTAGVETLFERYRHITCHIAIGNCDGYGNIIAAVRHLPNVTLDTVVHFELGGRYFGISHIEGMAERSLKDQPVDVFIHGHTHRAEVRERDRTLTVNPGSLMEGAGFMVIDVSTLQVERRFLLT